jgi:hypothetical protein
MIDSLFIKEYSWIIHDIGHFVKRVNPIPGIAADYGVQAPAGRVGIKKPPASWRFRGVRRG